MKIVCINGCYSKNWLIKMWKMYFRGKKALTKNENKYTMILLQWDDSVDIMPWWVFSCCQKQEKTPKKRKKNQFLLTLYIYLGILPWQQGGRFYEKKLTAYFMFSDGCNDGFVACNRTKHTHTGGRNGRKRCSTVGKSWNVDYQRNGQVRYVGSPRSEF